MHAQKAHLDLTAFHEKIYLLTSIFICSKLQSEDHVFTRHKCRKDHFTLDSIQLSTSWSPSPERELTSSVVIGWVADATMSSNRNRDCTSSRVIVQGISLQNNGYKRNKNNYMLILSYCSYSKWHAEFPSGGSPLVEENQHRSTVQLLCREDWQQLNTRRRYLSNVGRVHHKL